MQPTANSLRLADAPLYANPMPLGAWGFFCVCFQLPFGPSSAKSITKHTFRPIAAIRSGTVTCLSGIVIR